MFKRTKKITISKNDLEIQIKSEIVGKLTKTKKILFINQSNNNTFAKILTNHVIWDEQMVMLRNSLSELNQLKIKVTKKAKGEKSHISFLFK
jgi:hypothetical protein